MAVLDGQPLKDDVLITTICLVEVTSDKEDPNDLKALTSNLFLLVRANLATPFLPGTQQYSDLRRVIRGKLIQR